MYPINWKVTIVKKNWSNSNQKLVSFLILSTSAICMYIILSECVYIHLPDMCETVLSTCYSTFFLCSNFLFHQLYSVLDLSFNAFYWTVIHFSLVVDIINGPLIQNYIRDINSYLPLSSASQFFFSLVFFLSLLSHHIFSFSLKLYDLFLFFLSLILFCWYITSSTECVYLYSSLISSHSTTCIHKLPFHWTSFCISPFTTLFSFPEIKAIKVDSLRELLSTRRIDGMPNAWVTELCGMRKGMDEKIDDIVVKSYWKSEKVGQFSEWMLEKREICMLGKQGE